MHVVRKISKSKWFKINIFENSDVTADAITNCLKTIGNTLSVWHIKNETDIDEAILAIVSNQDYIETLDVVILNVNDLEKFDIKIVASDGLTPMKSLVKSHRDLSELTYTKLGFVKDNIVESIRNNKLKRFTKGELKKLLKEAIDKGMLQKSDLKESVRNKI